MSQIEIRQVTATDHAAWLPLWQAYLTFYNTELPDAVSHSTWQRLIGKRKLSQNRSAADIAGVRDGLASSADIRDQTLARFIPQGVSE